MCTVLKVSAHPPIDISVARGTLLDWSQIGIAELHKRANVVTMSIGWGVQEGGGCIDWVNE